MKIITINIHETSYPKAMESISAWETTRLSRYVCIANVHMAMEAYDSSQFADIVNHADLVTPDGIPLVWMIRLKGMRGQTRVYGPTLMLHILESAARDGIPVGFYGGKPDVLNLLTKKLRLKHPNLDVAYSFSPPFRPLSPSEDEAVVAQINASGTRILFVGLGCPKQEVWMAEHRGKVSAVMIGVGAAFDFHAGVLPQAPKILQSIGLEWLFRLIMEPRRLWKRYLYHNPRFVLLAVFDLLGFLKR